MTEKIDQKKLKGPDAFQVQIMALFDWLVKNQKLVGLMVLPLVVVVIAGFGWQWFADRSMGKRLDALAKIEDEYSAEMLAAGKQREEIQKKIESLSPATAASPSAAPPSPQIEAQRRDLEKQRDAIKPDHNKSLASFRKFHDEHKNQSEGWLAGMRAVAILLEQDKAEDARPILEAVAKESIAVPFYQIQSRLILVGLNEDAGNWDAAMKDVDTLMGLVDDDMKPKLLLAKGRIQFLRDAKSDAKTTLGELLTKYANAPEAQKARGILALIN